MAAIKTALPRAMTLSGLTTAHAATPRGTTAESTTTVVIGSGFSALAIATELNRQGIETIVVDSSIPVQHSPVPPTTGGISLAALSERSEIVRLLEHYARRHEMDIRPATQALDFTHLHGDNLHGAVTTVEAGDAAGTVGEESAHRQWRVLTTSGTLTAHSIVFTRGALSQLRKVLHSAGVTTAAEVRTAMQALGLYLVGVGDLAIPTTQEILHQAKRASQSISARLAALESQSLAATA
ncbi:FAD-binding protein [Arthrobacter sp. Sr24]